MLETEFKSSCVVFVTNIDVVKKLVVLILVVHGDVDDILGCETSMLKQR